MLKKKEGLIVKKIILTIVSIISGSCMFLSILDCINDEASVSNIAIAIFFGIVFTTSFVSLKFKNKKTYLIPLVILDLLFLLFLSGNVINLLFLTVTTSTIIWIAFGNLIRRKILNEKHAPTNTDLSYDIDVIDEINNTLASTTKYVQIQPTEDSTVSIQQESLVQPIQNWEISVSFGKSTSKSFGRALYIAKNARRYNEYEMDGDTIHQAYFRADKEEYLNFIRLYELVSNWKSSAVLINGELIDRKIIGGINYCYGDKCRNGRSDFCFGASEYTENPFGCHRLQISTYNNPWWTFGHWRGNTFNVDKNAIQERIKEYSTAYSVCPHFNYDVIMFRLKMLPDRISRMNYNAILMGDRRYMSAFKNTKELK